MPSALVRVRPIPAIDAQVVEVRLHMVFDKLPVISEFP